MTKPLSQSALILAAHGSHRNPMASTVVHAHADAIRGRKLFAQVKSAFWHGDPGLSETVSAVTAGETYVVPVFGSEGHFTKVILPRELKLAGPSRVHLCAPVGSHSRIPELLHKLAASTVATHKFGPDDTDVLVIGHGGKTSKGPEHATQRAVDGLRKKGNFRSVTALFLEQSPNIKSWREIADGKAVVAVPFLIGGGGHEGEIPERIGLSPGSLSGEVGKVRVAVSPSVGGMNELADLIVDQVVNYTPET